MNMTPYIQMGFFFISLLKWNGCFKTEISENKSLRKN